MAIDDDKDVNVQSGADMGFGGGIDLGNVGTGAVFDAATDRGFGGGLGLTEDRAADLRGQVSQGEGDAWGPSFGTRSKSGTAVGAVLGALTGMPAAAAIGAYGPGAFNSIMGRGGTPSMPGIFGSGANSIATAGAPGGLLGLGGDRGEAEALAELYLLLRAAGQRI